MIFICNYDPFGYDRVKYTIRNMCVEEPEMPYDDGAQTTVLYTKGTKGDDISEELRQFLNYMENTTQTNAVNDTLKDIQKMVDIVKRDGEVSLSEKPDEGIFIVRRRCGWLCGGILVNVEVLY